MEAVPKEARVKVLNIRPEFYQGMKLEPGRYHVEIAAAGYKTRKRWIELGAGEDKNLKISLKRVVKARQKEERPLVQLAPKGYDVFLKVGAFVDKDSAHRLRSRLVQSAMFSADISTVDINGRTFHRVRVGPMAQEEITKNSDKLKQFGIEKVRVIIKKGQ